MAKTVRTAGTTKLKVAGPASATSTKAMKQAKEKAVISAALFVEVAIYNLRWAHRGYNRGQNRASELAALLDLKTAEMGRRVQTVKKAIRAARKVMHQRVARRLGAACDRRGCTKSTASASSLKRRASKLLSPYAWQHENSSPTYRRLSLALPDWRRARAGLLAAPRLPAHAVR